MQIRVGRTEKSAPPSAGNHSPKRCSRSSITSGLIISQLIFQLIISNAIADFMVKKDLGIATTGRPGQHAVFDGNAIRFVTTNDGALIARISASFSGFQWPAGTVLDRIFYGEVWLSGVVNGEISGAANFRGDFDFRPGIIDPGTHLPADPANPRFKIYKINRGDSLSSDYLNWPVQDGAPVDEQGKPLLLGDQLLWCVFNEGDSLSYPAQAPRTPMGLEVQQMIYGFNRPGSHLHNSVFIRYTVINKGIHTIDSCMIGNLLDPDNYYYTRNHLGIDSTSGLVFVYNRQPVREDTGLPGPAIGFQWLGGLHSPADSSQAVELPLYAFIQPKLPDLDRLERTLSRDLPYWFVFHQMLGFDPYLNPFTIGGNGTHPYNPVTRFLYTGNPLTGQGWVDETPGDKYFLWSTTPVTMQPGDSLRMEFAIINARAGNPMKSLELLFSAAEEIRQVHAGEYQQLPPGLTVNLLPLSQSEILADLRATAPEAAAVEVILRRPNGSSLPPIALNDDGADGDSLAGDGIWSAQQALQRESCAYTANVRVTDETGFTRLWPAQVSGIQTNDRGPRILDIAVDSDDLTNDGILHTSEQVSFAVKLENTSSLSFDDVVLEVGSWDQFDLHELGTLHPYHTRMIANVHHQSMPDSFSAANPIKIEIGATLYDKNGGIFSHLSRKFPVEPLPFKAHRKEAEPVGKGIPNLIYWQVVNPDELTGHQYWVHAKGTPDSLLADVEDRTVGVWKARDISLRADENERLPIIDGVRLSYVNHIPYNDIEVETSVQTQYFEFRVYPQFPYRIETDSSWYEIRFLAAPEDTTPVGVYLDSEGNEIWMPRVVYDSHGKLNRIDSASTPVGVWYLGPYSADTTDDYRVHAFLNDRGFSEYNLMRYLIIPDARVNGNRYDQPFFYPGHPRNNITGPEYWYDSKFDWLFWFYFHRSSPTIPWKWNKGDRYRIRMAQVFSEGDIYQYQVRKQDVFSEPLIFTMHPVYPNPFNSRAQITYMLPEPSRVQLDVFNILGQRVATLVDEPQRTGPHRVEWRPESLASGMYFVRFRAGGYQKVRKMVLMK